MNDIHQKALERARQRAGAPQADDTAFASERERAKKALRAEMNRFNGQNVTKISAFTQGDTSDRKLRVAAYCRVSTDDEDQVISMELQKKNYRELITGTPNWIYYGTFVDDGYSGTNTEHRRAFQLMMKHAEEGRFDMIITKSVSRFARNLIDCITWVRTLQAHDPPIAVFFEQEGINTLNTSSNIILFVLAMVAEEESHMKSEAMLLSLEWRFSRGRFLIPAILGYDKIVEPDGNGGFRKFLRVNEDEARTIRLMYYMLVNGEPLTKIADTLTDLQRETGWRKISPKLHNNEWTPGAVRNVLRNQKYCGDILARKTWTPDFHDHKSRPNRGDKNKYYQADHHEAIVSRAIWNAAQRILNSNRYRGSGGYLPMRVIDHGLLCGFISMNRAWAGFTLDDYFYVSSVAMGQTEGTLEADLQNEHLPDGGYAMGTLSGEGDVMRIARQLTREEMRAKAELTGAEPEEDIPKIKPGYQVVDSDMFSHANDPVVRFTRRSIAFNSTCIVRLNRFYETPDGMGARRVRYVEFLLNPIERMVAVRPCSPDHPNAMRWSDDRGNSIGIGATALCKTLFTLQNWDTDYSFRVPVSVVERYNETVLLFDLDNYIGSEIGKKTPAVLRPEDGEPAEVVVEEAGDTSGFFYCADDEVQSVEMTEEMQRRMRQIAEYEEKRFGTPVYEFDEEPRVPECEDDDWALMAEARPLDIEHTVDERIITDLQDELLEELIAAEAQKDDQKDARNDAHTGAQNDIQKVDQKDAPKDSQKKTQAGGGEEVESL